MARSRRRFFNFFKNVKRSKPHLCSYKAVLIAKARVGRGEAGNFGKVGGGGGVGPRTSNSVDMKRNQCAPKVVYLLRLSHTTFPKLLTKRGRGPPRASHL